MSGSPAGCRRISVERDAGAWWSERNEPFSGGRAAGYRRGRRPSGLGRDGPAGPCLRRRVDRVGHFRGICPCLPSCRASRRRLRGRGPVGQGGAGKRAGDASDGGMGIDHRLVGLPVPQVPARFVGLPSGHRGVAHHGGNTAGSRTCGLHQRPRTLLVRGVGRMGRPCSPVGHCATIRYPWPPDAAAIGAGRGCRRLLAAQPWISRSASLWWPDDHAWCVGTDIDLMTTYVGARARCAGRLLAEAALETLPVSAGQRVTWDSDTINPQPPAPH
jgi:hypothetical protein